jgi:hypothetical protein
MSVAANRHLTGHKAVVGDLAAQSPKTGLSSLAHRLSLGARRSTNLIARARKDTPEKGGWNLLHTWWLASDVINPAVHFGLSGAGSRAWFGWPDVPQLQRLITDWVRATDDTRRKQLANEVQRVALDEVTYVPWGEWVQPTAFRAMCSSSEHHSSGM